MSGFEKRLASAFETLSDTIDLWKAGRKNAAVSQWKSLPKEFQEKVLDYTLFVLEHASQVSSMPSVELRSSKFGIFNCSRFALLDLVEIIPALV